MKSFSDSARQIILVFKGKTVAQVNTNQDGSFIIRGSQKAKAMQRGYLWIEHSCDQQKRVSIHSFEIRVQIIPGNFFV